MNVKRRPNKPTRCVFAIAKKRGTCPKFPLTTTSLVDIDFLPFCRIGYLNFNLRSYYIQLKAKLTAPHMKTIKIFLRKVFNQTTEQKGSFDN